MDPASAERLGTLLGEESCCVGVDLSREMLAMAQAKIADCRHTYVIQTDVTQPLRGLVKDAATAVAPVSVTRLM